jgi:hypothetical protein
MYHLRPKHKGKNGTGFSALCFTTLDFTCPKQCRLNTNLNEQVTKSSAKLQLGVDKKAEERIWKLEAEMVKFKAQIADLVDAFGDGEGETEVNDAVVLWLRWSLKLGICIRKCWDDIIWG